MESFSLIYKVNKDYIIKIPTNGFEYSLLQLYFVFFYSIYLFYLFKFQSLNFP